MAMEHTASHLHPIFEHWLRQCSGSVNILNYDIHHAQTATDGMLASGVEENNAWTDSKMSISQLLPHSAFGRMWKPASGWVRPCYLSLDDFERNRSKGTARELVSGRIQATACLNQPYRSWGIFCARWLIRNILINGQTGKYSMKGIMSLMQHLLLEEVESILFPFLYCS